MMAFRTDWRLKENFYLVEGTCDVCGDWWEIGQEPRFLYNVCFRHKDVPPVTVGQLKVDPIARAARRIRQYSSEEAGVYAVEFQRVYDIIKEELNK
jgi:hypothetical protein